MKNHVNAAAVEQILHVSAPTVCSRWTSTAERERLVSLSLMVVHAAGVVPAVGCCPRSSGACGSTCAALQKDASKFLWTVLGTSVSFWDRSKALSARTVVVTRSLLSVNTARERAARRWVVPSKSVLWKQARPLYTLKVNLPYTAGKLSGRPDRALATRRAPPWRSCIEGARLSSLQPVSAKSAERFANGRHSQVRA